MKCWMSAPASTDPHGELVSSGAGIPTFVGVLDKAVKRIVELHGLDTIRDGDCFITNDPYYGGVTHLNDVVIALPVFADGECVAWAASIAHWNDVGGKTPGSMAVDVSEIFQEGLRLPAVKLFERGQADRFGHSTSSRPTRACRISCAATCGRRSRRAARPRHASAIGRNLWHRRLSRRHRRASSWRASGAGARGLAALAAGRIQHRGRAGRRRGVARRDHHFAATASRSTSRGNPTQRAAPYNTSRDGAVISCQMIFKALTDPTLFANAGSFRRAGRRSPSRAPSSMPTAPRRTATISRPASGSTTCCGNAWPGRCRSVFRPGISRRSAAR